MGTQATTAGETAIAAPHGWRWSRLLSLNGLLNDEAVRYGIKFGVAGVLAVFIALYFRLPEPTWALFTVYVLMIAQYVGAIAEKSFFRMIGTAVGGLIGYIVTASFEQNPIVYLTILGIVIAASTAMFGQSRYPYAFLLCGLTTVVVSSNGLANPDMSWEYMMMRVQEVAVGIVVTIVVQCLFWPRYARDVFSLNAKNAFADLQGCFHSGAAVILGEADPNSRKLAEDFPARITALRGLLEFGARESLYFRQRLPTYFKITTCLSRIASAVATLGDPLPVGSFYRNALTDQLSRMHSAIEAALGDLSRDESTTETRRQHRENLKAAFESLTARLLEMRQDKSVFTVPVEDATSIGMHGLALDDIREQITLAHELLDSLPTDAVVYSKEIEPFVSPWPPPFWIKAGIKSGIAVVIAMILDDWLNPPGGTMMVLGAWVFTATNASSPGGSGDQRAFDFAVYTTIAMTVLSLLVLLGSPMLSSYAVMNIILFTWMFVWGYLSFTTRGMTIPMQLGMLGSVSLLGLNGQEPVSFQAVVGFFFGIVLAQILAAVIQRTIWPSLPQWELRNRLLEQITLSQRIIKEGPESLPFWQRARLALIPGEAAQRIAALPSPLCPDDEPERLTAYLHALRHVGNHLVVTIGKLGPLLPPAHADRGRELIENFEKKIHSQLEQHEKGLRESGLIQVGEENIEEMIDVWDKWMRELRAFMIANNVPMKDSLRILGFAGRYVQAGRDLITAGECGSKLRMPLYMGDYVL